MQVEIEGQNSKLMCTKPGPDSIGRVQTGLSGEMGPTNLGPPKPKQMTNFSSKHLKLK